MDTPKRLRRARRAIAANPAHAPSLRKSLRSYLTATATGCPDEREREIAASALAVLTEHQWGEAGWDALGVPVPRTRPVGHWGAR